ncbi:MAG: hypothetical protein RBS57_20510 [Desulforhabdus sp.]|jgi:hypothetical protein|nr:hypothetical protein [Desulforhabdus sp.]
MSSEHNLHRAFKLRCAVLVRHIRMNGSGAAIETEGPVDRCRYYGFMDEIKVA